MFLFFFLFYNFSNLYFHNIFFIPVLKIFIIRSSQLTFTIIGLSKMHLISFYFVPFILIPRIRFLDNHGFVSSTTIFTEDYNFQRFLWSCFSTKVINGRTNARKDVCIQPRKWLHVRMCVYVIRIFKRHWCSPENKWSSQLNKLPTYSGST